MQRKSLRTALVGRIVSTAVVPALLFTGCALPVKHATPSGKVEVTISGASAKQVGPPIINQMVNRKYRLAKSSQHAIQFEKPVENVFAAALFGSRYDSKPMLRIIYSLIDLGDKTRVVADFHIVTNPGSAFERITVANTNASTVKFQKLLDQVKASFDVAKRVPDGATYLGIKVQAVSESVALAAGLDQPSGALVFDVDDGSPAAISGLLRGDIIQRVSNRPVKNHAAVARIVRARNPGDVLTLLVWRNRARTDLRVVLGRK